MKTKIDLHMHTAFCDGKNTPEEMIISGINKGLTTIGLFLGSVPIFFFKFTTVKANCTVIAILTVFCLIAMQIIIRKDEKKDA